MRWRAWHASGSSITLHRRRHQLRERTDEIGRHNSHHASFSFKEDLKQFLVAQHRVFAVERLGLLSRPHFHSSFAELIDYYLIAGGCGKSRRCSEPSRDRPPALVAVLRGWC